MTRKFTFLLMALLALTGLKGWGQTEIQIGAGTGYQGTVPFYNYYYYSYSQMLYLGSEIGQSGTITSISFDLSRATSLNGMKFDIYMKCVSKDSYSGNSDWVVVTGEDLVYSATLNTVNSGWATFTLDTPFEYDNTQGNLMIAFDNNTGSCTGPSGYAQFYYTSTLPTYTCIYYYNDYTNIDPTNPTQQANGTTYQRPNIKMTIESSASCPKPKDLAASNVTATGATISWTGSAESYDVAYGVASTFDLNNPTTYTLREGLNTTSVQLSDLTAETVYKYAVKAHCSDEEESNWSNVAVFFATNSEFVTLNNGTDHAQYEYMPFYGLYVHNYDTKSEIIYPASDLQSLTGKNINNLTFYASVSDHDFGSDAWDVYVKEVNYTNPGQTGYAYTNDYASMSKVYSGPLSINDHKMYIILDESFVYNSQNLMICFQQTSHASGTNADISWDGVNPGGSSGSDMRSRGGYTGVNSGNASSAFLPKTTFGYIPSVTYTVNFNQPEVGGTIDANPKTDVAAGTTVTLSATPATGYEFGEWTVINSTTSQEITVTDNQFEMPESNVTVTATFEALTQRYVNISQTIEHGTVTATPNQCYKGDTVSLTFEPAEGYSDPRLEQVTVTDANGDVVSLGFLSFTFTMPDSDVTVSATFNKNYSIVVGNHEHSDVYVGLATVAEGNNASFQVTPAADYQIESVSVVHDGGQMTLEPSFVASGTYVYNFTMPSSDVTINVEVSAIQYVVATVGILPSEGIGTCNAFEETGKPLDHLLGGETIYVNGINVNYDYLDDYVFESVSVVYDNEQHTEIQLTPEGTGSYSFQMPTCNVTIKVSFRELQSYTINYYVNGEFKGAASCKENAPIDTYTYRPYDVYGVNFEGWGVAPIGTYVTEKPTIIGEEEYPTHNYDLHAVFSYSETLPAAKGGETWEKVTSTSELSAGDEIVFVYNNLIMCNREEATDQGYPTTNVTITDNEITSLPSNTAQFTLVENNGYWKLQYEELGATRFLATSSVAYDLASDDFYQSWSGWGDVLVNWTAVNNNNSVIFKNDNINNYIGYYTPQSQMSVMGISTACQTYKKGASVITNTYYMTSVLTNGEVADATVKNIIVANPITVSGRLEMNAEGLFRNEDAANFVFANGAEFYYTGEETVKATFEKVINGYSGTNDNYYLIANPTATEEVANLVNEDGYDLYTFNPAQALEWNNEKASNALTSGIGYLYANSEPVTLEFAGELTPADSINKSLTYAAAGAGIDFPGFNLLGNPYACNAFVSRQFYVINGSELVVSENNYVAPCEGFFVEATTTGQSVTISTTAPATASQAMSLTVSQNRGNVIDRAIVSFDGANDLHKFMMNPAHTNISLAKGGETFAAVSSDAEGEIPVSFKAEKNGSYTITVNTENVEAQYLHLIDNMTGADVDLLSSPSYTFNATTSDYASRFKLVFSMNNVENNQVEASCFAYISNGELIISNEGRATLQVIDVMGRIVRNQQIEGDARISTEGMTAGVYVLNLNGNVQKIVVR